MNFSGIPRDSLIGKLLRWPLHLLPKGLEVPVLQGRLRGKRWIVGSGPHGYWLGSYEYRQRKVFERLVSPGHVVFDIGAHVGFYTLLASVLVGPTGHVVAFEPLPRNLLYLRRHLSLNRTTNVHIFEGAVSSQEGLTTFEAGRQSGMGHLSLAGSIRVRTTTIDGFVRQHGRLRPDCLKIDVEGAELDVLLGARATLTEQRPILFLSTHSSTLHAECCRVLHRLGYDIRPLDGRAMSTSREVLASPAD